MDADAPPFDVIAHLAGLGPRPAGEPAEAAGAAYVAGVLRGLGLAVAEDPFAFLGWAQERPARVEVLAPEPGEMAAGAMAYAGSTPSGGLEGRLVRTGTMPLTPGLFEWPEYALLDDQGADVAFLVARAGGPAIPMPDSYPDPRLTRIVATIGEADGRRIDGWLAAGEEVRVRFDTAGRVVPGMRSRNVVATLPGRTDDELVVSCHLDTAPGAPGAIDNASGAQVMVDLARRLAAGPPPRKTIRFVGFGAEEYLMLGATHYAGRRATRGTIGRVAANLNLDTVGVGDTLLCLGGPAPVAALLREAAESSGATAFFKDIAVLPPKPAADNWPFFLRGVPNLSVVVWPYAEYHLPCDDLPLVDPAVVARVSALTGDLVARLDAADPAALRAVF